MKHIFIINKNAANGKIFEKVQKKIISVASEKNIDYDIFITDTQNDAYEVIKTFSEKYVKLRVYACGGDGTVSQIANCIHNIAPEKIELAVIPAGTGNDFVKSFTNPGSFYDISNVIDGECEEIDAIKFNSRICINILNCGFDSAVVAETETIKKSGFAFGSFSYILGLVKCLLKMPDVNLTLELCDGSVISDRFLLFVAANGLFYGGGFKAASEASLNDGLIDIVAVKRISLLRFLTLVSKYKNGTIINTEIFKKVGIFFRAMKIKIINDKDFLLCSDGELMKVKTADIEIHNRAIKFVVPKGCSIINKSNHKTTLNIDERTESRT